MKPFIRFNKETKLWEVFEPYWGPIPMVFKTENEARKYLKAVS